MNKRSLAATLLVLLPLLGPSVHAASLRVTPAWLQAHLHDPQLLILDTRHEAEYLRAHIPGALNLPDRLTYQQKSEGGLIVEPDIMQTLLRERGIDKSKLVVIYDSGQLIDAARVFWTLEVYGLTEIKILSPGYDAWIADHYPSAQEIPDPALSHYVATINQQRIASKFSTQLATVNPNLLVVDARNMEAYKGDTSTAKRFGHIPSALNYPVGQNFSKRGGTVVLKDKDELEKIYAPLPKDRKIVLYCEIGRTSSANYLVLRELGYDVANYDGSWREWGNDDSLPIEK